MNRTRFSGFFAIVASAGQSGCTGHRPAGQPPVPVKVQAVTTGPGTAGTRYSAAVLPAVQLEVAFKVTGYVDALAQVRPPNGTVR